MAEKGGDLTRKLTGIPTIDAPHRLGGERRFAGIGQDKEFAPAMCPIRRLGDWPRMPPGVVQVADAGTPSCPPRATPCSGSVQSALGQTRSLQLSPPAIDLFWANLGTTGHLVDHGPRRQTLSDDRSLLILGPTSPTLWTSNYLYSPHRTVSCTGANTVFAPMLTTSPEPTLQRKAALTGRLLSSFVSDRAHRGLHAEALRRRRRAASRATGTQRRSAACGTCGACADEGAFWPQEGRDGGGKKPVGRRAG